MFLSLMFCHLSKSLQQCCHGNLMMITGQIYFWLPGDIVITDWSIVVSKASWQCIVLLGQLAWSTHFASCCPTSWMLSGFSLLSFWWELRNKLFLAFWIIICPFSTQKCQCSALNLASVLEKCGFWNVHRLEDLDI